MDTTTQDVMNPQFYFQTGVYIIKKPEFLSAVKTVADENLGKLEKIKPELDEIYPVRMSENLSGDARIQEFAQMVAGTGWNILNSQGYDMDKLQTFFTEMWCQEHFKHSGMEQHVHAGAAQLVGFYFLETPENCSMACIHDPRPSKVQIALPMRDPNQPSEANPMLFFKPEAGMLMFTNAWLAHSFTRHASSEPCKFIHFGLGAQPVTIQQPQAAIVV